MKKNNIQKMPKAGQAGNGTKPNVRRRAAKKIKAMEKDLSTTAITNDGRILKDISDKKEIPCPTCKGKGEIPDPKAKNNGKVYFGGYPHIDCRTCNGEGWVLVNG